MANKNKQQMRLNKVRYKDYVSKPEYKDNPKTMYRAGVKSLTVMTNSHLIKNVVNHAGLKEAQVKAVLLALPLAVRDYALAGDGVQILNLCTIKPSIKATAVTTEAACTVDTIKTKKIRVIPTGDLASVMKDWNFIMTDDVVNGEMEGEDGGVDNEQQTEPTKYTLTLKDKDDATVSTAQLAAGAAITYPAAPTGQKWPDSKPSVMPAANTEVKAILSAAEKYTITYNHNSSVYTTQEYEVGATVTEPAAPTGYIWLNVPSQMPARNVTCESYEDDPNNI